MDETSAACEDLRYFERRLTEVIQSMQPAATRWRLVLLIAFGCTLWSAYFWLKDPSIRSTAAAQRGSYWNQARVMGQSYGTGYVNHVSNNVIASRCRSVLADFSLSCDDSGKLIVRPPHRVHVSP
ncbi:unnamed protein product [Onchocerca ochengi]|uniref:Transmembrane protein 188 n=1 Tax=Onchocerca ochengi TaxID=42157 RepID=A0A182DYI5_ONCOC|nr:unnamed protein product [Onchocerca ochengi]